MDNAKNASAKISNSITIGKGHPLTLLAGPCVIEGEAFTLRMAEKIATVCNKLSMPFIFKCSFDKANRTSGKAYRGVSMSEGLAILQKVKEKIGVPVVTDIHEREQASPVAEVVDILQIPAFLCRQTDLLTAAAKTGRAVNVKKGQFLAPWDMKNVVAKLRADGASNILLTERGSCFGYNTLVVDYRALPQMQDLGCPVVFDATHSVQMPGGAGTATSGQRQFIPHLARAAVAVGIDALFLEVHEDPDNAPSDGPNMLRLNDLEGLLTSLLKIRAVV